MSSSCRFLALGVAAAIIGTPAAANEPHSEHHSSQHPHAVVIQPVRPAPTVHPKPPTPQRVLPQARVVVQPSHPVHPERAGTVRGPVAQEHIEERHVIQFQQPKIVEPSHYHVNGRYLPPRGYRYRVWVVGQMLPRPYWVRRYWILDYWDYNLDEPSNGLEWIRYGSDALLVNLRTGQVVEVVSDVFE
jgi:Ni/Co efflux regulator RcnB